MAPGRFSHPFWYSQHPELGPKDDVLLPDELEVPQKPHSLSPDSPEA